jgi:hypothetical protein
MPDDRQDNPSAYFEGLTGGEMGVSGGARVILLCQKTPAVFTCGDTRCPYSLQTWEAELPSVTWGTARAWPKCPEKHRARLVDVR